MRREIPPPSEAVFRREMEDLAEDLHSFVGMIRETRPDWLALEMKFGLDEGTDPVSLQLPGGGSLLLWGAIDRLDRVLGGLGVVDYKTGFPFDYQPATGSYHGGRRLQNALYLLAAEAITGEPVRRMAYHFPTRRGENREVPFERGRLEDALAVVDALLEVASAGRFLPTDHSNDCKICEFRSICRVQIRRWGVKSPMAEWGEEQMETPVYALFRRVRDWEEPDER
jgi:ATP-dependent helicase/nuclease subunit B